tara:strand:+ start:10 stop:681 length:672 start_codon:yes stop_codon:yes gene_type:complete
MDILKGFNWGGSNNWYRETIFKEIFMMKIYEKYFEVNEGDIVFDAGASIGPFSFSIKDQNPKHIYCVEPSLSQIEVLEDNLSTIPHTTIPHGIGKEDILLDAYGFGDNKNQIPFPSKPFMEIVNENNIENIDFLKTDCEGGEYDIFNSENIWWIKNNIKKIAGEWHLSTPELKAKFRAFRDTYLRLFPNHMVSSVNGVDIKWDLWNDHFIDYYNEIIIYIDNR